MKVTIEFEDNERKYTVDFLKIATKLGITAEDIQRVVIKEILKNG